MFLSDSECDGLFSLIGKGSKPLTDPKTIWASNRFESPLLSVLSKVKAENI